MDGYYRMEFSSIRGWASRAVDAASPLGDGPLAAAAGAVLALGCAFSGDVAEAEAARSEAAQIVAGLADQDLARYILATPRLAVAELYLARYEEAGALARRALAIARATGRADLGPVQFWVGTIQRARGRLAEAAEHFETGAEVARLAGHSVGVGWNVFGRSLGATSAGDADRALTAAEESLEALREREKILPTVGAGLAHAAALLLAGDASRARDVLLGAAGGEELPLLPAVWRPEGFELLVRSQLSLGGRDSAARTAARARALADALGLRPAAAMADRAAAAVALDAGEPAVAAELALRAADTADAVGAPVEAALSRMLGGRALAQAGDVERATAELERAATRFEDCGAQRRRDEAERELGRIGRRRHRRTRRGAAEAGGIESLTEREMQVARLIVDRRTNAEIAGELFPSPKTVETHVRNLFFKLDVASRVDVARAVEHADRERVAQV